jgi:glutamate carboxypeptidase
MRLLLVCAVLLTVCASAQAQPRSVEKVMMQTVVDEHERSISLLEKLVNQNSGSLNVDGVKVVGEMMRAELEPLGFNVRWADMAETGRAGHLIATHAGKGKNVLLIGHLDTVFEPDSPFQKFVRDGNEATGPGVGDDKGGIVVIVAALRAMNAAGTLKDANVTVVLTGDEERPGAPLAIGRRDLIAAGKSADYALEYEGLIVDKGKDYATVARRGAASWTLTTGGRTGHSSGVFNGTLGYGAIYEMARILDRFRKELREPNLTFNIGVIAGGTPAAIDADGFRVTASGKTNVVPETAIARGDLRALTPEQEAGARAKMQAIVADHLRKTTATLAFSDDGYSSMPPTKGNRALLAKLNKVNRDLGLAEMGEWDPAKRGAADSSFVAADVDVLAGMGGAGFGSHAEGERMDLDSLIRQAQRNAVLISRLSLGKY